MVVGYLNRERGSWDFLTSPGLKYSPTAIACFLLKANSKIFYSKIFKCQQILKVLSDIWCNRNSPY